MSETIEQLNIEDLNPAYVAEAKALLAGTGEDNLYGLSVEVLAQEAVFGDKRGSVAKMLMDVGCPVKGMVEKAYQEEGVEGVVKKFDLLNEMDSSFNVYVPHTVSADPDRGKKKVDEQAVEVKDADPKSIFPTKPAKVTNKKRAIPSPARKTNRVNTNVSGEAFLLTDNDAPQGPPPELPSFEEGNNDLSQLESVDELADSVKPTEVSEAKPKHGQASSQEFFDAQEAVRDKVVKSKMYSAPLPTPKTVKSAKKALVLPKAETEPSQIAEVVAVHPRAPVMAAELDLPSQVPNERRSLPSLFLESETINLRHVARPVHRESSVSVDSSRIETSLSSFSLELPKPSDELSLIERVYAEPMVDMDVAITKPALSLAAEYGIVPDFLSLQPMPVVELPKHIEVSMPMLTELKALPSSAERATRRPTLPLVVQQRMTQVFEVAPPIEKVKIAQLHVSIAHTVEKLQKLTGKEHDHEEQKVQLQEELGELYEELLTNLDIEVDEEAVAQFVEAAIPDLETEASFLDQAEVFQSGDGTHERKLFALSLAKNLPKWVSRRHNTLAKFILELTTAPSLEYAPAVQVS